MVNLTTIQGIFHYVNTFKKGDEKFELIGAIKTEMKKTKHRHKHGLYVIFEEDGEMCIETHNIYSQKFVDLVNSFKKCVYIYNREAYIKYPNGDVIEHRLVSYDGVYKYLLDYADKDERLHNYKKKLSKLIDNIDNNLYKWYTLDDTARIYKEYCKNNIQLTICPSACGKYFYFDESYRIIKDYSRKDVYDCDIIDINFNTDIYNIDYCYTILLTDNNEPCFISKDIISNNVNDIEDKFKALKSRCIEWGEKNNVDNSKLGYTILGKVS